MLSDEQLSSEAFFARPGTDFWTITRIDKGFSFSERLPNDLVELKLRGNKNIKLLCGEQDLGKYQELLGIRPENVL